MNSPEVEEGETREIAAKKAGFGSEFSYRQAKTVTQKGTPELIAAMDKGNIAVSASVLAAQV